ncbi:6422_t:CDS:2, partial [Racocetra fulgida]
IQYDSHELLTDNEKDLLTNENIPTTACNLLGLEFENSNENLPLIDTPFEIKVGTQFLSMLIVVHFVEQYARQNQFAVFKHKYEKFKDGTCKKRVFKCDLGGRYCEKLLTPVLDSSIVTVTTFNNEHNHEISAETLKFAIAYKTFTQEIIDEIEFYVVHSRCNASTIKNLLQPKYPDCVFMTQDLGNAIQKIKWEKGLDQSDAAALLSKLFELQAHDPAWFDERQESYEWLLKCYLDACEIPLLTFVTDADPAMIAAASVEFLKDFKNIQSSHCESVFEQRSQVKCFTSQHFTAGTQSIQHVESENVLIKKAMQSSFSFLEVQEVLEKRLEFESQMCQSVCYHAYKVQMSEISTLDDDSFEPLFDQETDDSSEIPVEANEN